MKPNSYKPLISRLETMISTLSKPLAKSETDSVKRFRMEVADAVRMKLRHAMVLAALEEASR